MRKRRDDHSARVRELLPKRVFLHVGMSKAGSTAIQNAFDRNYEFLLSRGLLFPRSVFSRRNPFNPHRTSGHLQLIRNIRNNSLEGFLAELQATITSCHQLVLSAENIFSEIDDDHCESLAQLLKGKKVEIFCILRPQIAWCASRYYESVVKGKHKEKARYTEFVERLIAAGRLNYHDRLVRLQSMFEAEKVTTVDYDEVKVEGGSVQAMLLALGISEVLPQPTVIEESNPSCPYPEAIEAHRQLNTIADILSHEEYLQWCSQMEATAAELRSQRGLSVSHIRANPELQRRILDACEEQNRLLSEVFLESARLWSGPRPDNDSKQHSLDSGLVSELVSRGIELLRPFSEAAGRRSKELRAARKHLESILNAERHGRRAAKVEPRDADNSYQGITRADVARIVRKLKMSTGLSDVNEPEQSNGTSPSNAVWNRVQNLERQLRDVSETANAHKTELNVVLKSLSEAEAESDELRSILEEAKRNAERYAAECETLRTELQQCVIERDEEVGALQKRIDEATDRALVLERHLTTTYAELNSKIEAVENLVASNLEHEKQLKRLEAEVKRLASTVEAKERLRKGLLRERGNLRKEYTLLSREIKGLESQYGELVRRFEGVMQSTSWKITRPCRQFVRFARRLTTGAPTDADWVPPQIPQRFSSSDRTVEGAAPAIEKRAPIRRAEGRRKRTAESGSTVADPIELKRRKREERRLKETRTRLLNLGFVERGLADLAQMASTGSSPGLRRRAIKELMTWHLNRPSADDWWKAISYFDAVGERAAKGEDLRHLAILAAEAYRKLDRPEMARRLLLEALSSGEHCDLYLALSNVEEHPVGKAHYINRALQLEGVEGVHFEHGQSTLYDGLRAISTEYRNDPVGEVLVSIVMPAYNACRTLRCAIDAILAQTWSNFELLIVNDASTDSTLDLGMSYCEIDERVRVITLKANSGPYVARNVGLEQAKGVFVTCNDSDDWSHPRKLELQARHLLENTGVVGNTSTQARAFEDMTFFRRGKYGYTQMNISSLMFRREVVLERIGYWDCVRFGGDSDYLRRMKAAFGNDAVVDLPTAPLSFQRQTESSLTASPKFGYNGYKAGARLEYDRQVKRNIEAGNLRLDFPQHSRPFPIPAPLRIGRRADLRHFDVVIASDFRLPGGSSASSAEEIQAQKENGLTTGLVQIPIYEINTARTLNERVARLVDGERVEMIVYGEEVTCDLLIVRHPWILQERTTLLPRVKARDVRVIVNQPPKRDYSDTGETLYDIETCAARCSEYFGTSGVWHPIGPLVREALLDHHQRELRHIDLDPEDWPNIINLAEWQRKDYRRPSSSIRIGRHSRDAYVKWPDSPETLLAAYPNREPYEVHVLGGASTPSSVLGGLPDNWHVMEFGSLDPKEFLRGIDVFVYYTHPSWVEAFGRVIIEAMAVGVPVILPYNYEKLFRNAAIYASPNDVVSIVEELVADEDRYMAHVRNAWAFVDANFGYKLHVSRISRSRLRHAEVGSSSHGPTFAVAPTQA